MEGKKGMKYKVRGASARRSLSTSVRSCHTIPVAPNRHAPPSQPFSKALPFSDGEADSLLARPFFSALSSSCRLKTTHLKTHTITTPETYSLVPI